MPEDLQYSLLFLSRGRVILGTFCLEQEVWQVRLVSVILAVLYH